MRQDCIPPGRHHGLGAAQRSLNRPPAGDCREPCQAIGSTLGQQYSRRPRAIGSPRQSFIGVAYEADLAHDLEKIQKAIQDIGKELVHEAALESACLLDSFGNEELEERDLEIMQERVTALENYIDPYDPKEDSNA